VEVATRVNRCLTLACAAKRIVILLSAALLLGACATRFEKPGPFDEISLRGRAESVSEDGIRVSAVIPNQEESQAIFGVDLAKKNIQPLWLEIENNTDRQIIFLPTGLDPEYFSPLEVAFGFHKEFSGDSHSYLDRHIENTGLHYFLNPHSTQSGFVFTHVDQKSKFVTVDLIGRKWTKSFTLIVPTPDSNIAEKYYERLVKRLKKSAFVEVDEESRLRELLERLPCCTSSKEGKAGEPLNLVLIGELNETAAAIRRRNYRISLTAARQVFGRPQDISISKLERWVAAQPHILRAWLTNIRFRGQPVWVGQVSTPLGGRFAGETDGNAVLPIDPDVDEARNDIVQDMIYSQSLMKLGFVKGVGRVTDLTPRKTSSGGTYHTDGLRAVLFFERKPIAISQLQFLGWERLAEHYRKQIDSGE
jgi:hypothetical protein